MAATTADRIHHGRSVACAALIVAAAACGSAMTSESSSVWSSATVATSSDAQPVAVPNATVPPAIDQGAVKFDDLDTAGLDAGVDGVLEVYCLLDANGEAHSVDAQLALPGFDPDDLASMQWVHDVIRSSDGSADFIAAAFATPVVPSDLDRNSQIILTDNTKTFLFQNQVPLLNVETIYPFRTGPHTASVLTTYVFDDTQQMLTQRWVLVEGRWVRSEASGAGTIHPVPARGR